MKKIYLPCALIILFSTFVHSFALAADQQKISPEKKRTGNMKLSGPVKSPSILTFGQDIIINPQTYIQRDVKIATAFNGWNYACFTISNGVDSGGYALMSSRDHGLSWNILDMVFDSGSVYYSAGLIVCGNDTSALDLYFSSVLYTPVDGNHKFFVDKYDANAGILLQGDVVHANTETDSIYDCALAHDFLHRASAHDSTLYGVEAVYSKSGSTQDSIIAIQSLNSGFTFSDRKTVDTTSSYFGKVSVSYGYSNFSHPNGRYFVAYEEHAFGATEGHIKQSGTIDDVTDFFSVPVYLDSLDSNWINRGSNPSISVQNSFPDNDSAGLSAVVAWESDFNGSGNADVAGVYNYDIVTNPWHTCWLENTSAHCKQPDLSYDESSDRFLATYWDSTNNSLSFKTQGYNFPAPAAWPLVALQYNDQVGTLSAPHPQVVIDPSFNMADFAWIETRGAYPTALFDAENSFTGIQNSKPASFSLSQNFPNPASDYTLIRFELDKSQPVVLDVYDLLGNKIQTVVNSSLTAGTHIFRMDVRNFPAGYYTYTLTSGEGQLTKKLLVVH